MGKDTGSGRRDFLRRAAWAVGAAAGNPLHAEAEAEAKKPVKAAAPPAQPHPKESSIPYPRVFEGRHLKEIAFPLGGVGAGSLSLGGRGQLREWEIFNRANKGFSVSYAFPSIWAQAGDAKPVARVLEARIMPPYEGPDGLGSNNVPGLLRLASARFTGEYPLAHIDFEDNQLQVKVSLDAFSPFIPLDPDDSGLPAAILRYQVTNPGKVEAKVSIAYSIENPAKVIPQSGDVARLQRDERQNDVRSEENLSGIFMNHPSLPSQNPMKGSFALAFTGAGNAALTSWRGWPQSRWWNAPMFFWDDFSDDGQLAAEPAVPGPVGALCVQRTIAPGDSADYTFILAWHFPNRTPDWCGWTAPKGEGQTIIGNYYATRFADAWEVARYMVTNLNRLESRTKTFAISFRESTIPSVVKEAASANLSTLASTTCFRTADGDFHGFEGVNDKSGCCFGNCTHVWNYETATAHLFPSMARSLRAASFGFSMDNAGAMHFRQLLPDGKERSGYAAADGQMGQIVHAYLDWKLSGDNEWLTKMWPRIKKGLEFAWVPGGWDANRDGVLEGVQHNTYDVEFYGPNPMCGIYYLAALRAGEKMARAMNDPTSADVYRKLADQGGRWIDENLFNGEFYIQQIQGYEKSQIAPSLRSTMGSENTEKPEYQVGAGCLVDQLVGQYLAEVAGLGPLVSPGNVRATLGSVFKYNYKRTLFAHDNVQRTFALNDESAVVVCDYGKADRPTIPFPYYAEVFTGLEHSTAAHMIYAGLVPQGIECIGNIRARYDGEKRNPWDEAECGHHYARAMSSWSSFLALSGFRYDGPEGSVSVVPPLVRQADFHSFWSTGTGWGTFALTSGRAGESTLVVRVQAGKLPFRSCEVTGIGKTSAATLEGSAIAHDTAVHGSRTVFFFATPVELLEGQQLALSLHG